MITCTLNGKKYSVDFISGRALREIGPAAEVYSKVLELAKGIQDDKLITEKDVDLDIGDAMDVLVKWFCLLFGNQFTPDDMLDYYPVDRIMPDIALALLAVQTQATEVLDSFPTTAAPVNPPKKTAGKKKT